MQAVMRLATTLLALCLALGATAATNCLNGKVQNMTAWKAASAGFNHAKLVRNMTVGDNYVYLELYETNAAATKTSWTPIAFVLCGTNTPAAYENITVVAVPVASIALTESPQYGFVKELNLTDRLVAVENPEYIDDAPLNALVSSGQVSSFACSATSNDTCTGTGCTWSWGYCSGVNNTKLEGISPAVVITGETALDTITASIPYVPLPGTSEPTLLAQAEYIKLFALILSADPTAAITYFDNAVSEYQTASALANQAGQSRPLVWTGYEYYGTFYYERPTSYAARVLADAGADYIFQNSTLSYLPSDLATAATKISISAANVGTLYPQYADFWYHNGINGPENTTAEVLALVPNTGAEQWRATRCGCIIANNKRDKVDGGSNAYFWDAYVHPHILLKDLITLLHPEIDLAWTTVFVQPIAPNGTVTADDCPMLAPASLSASSNKVNASATVLITNILSYKFAENFTQFRAFIANNLSVTVANVNIYVVSLASDDAKDRVRVHVDAVFLPNGRTVSQLQKLFSELLVSAALTIFNDSSSLTDTPSIGGAVIFDQSSHDTASSSKPQSESEHVTTISSSNGAASSTSPKHQSSQVAVSSAEPQSVSVPAGTSSVIPVQQESSSHPANSASALSPVCFAALFFALLLAKF